MVCRAVERPGARAVSSTHMLEPEVAQQNFAAIGYQPPQVTTNPDTLVSSGFIPENLKSAVVRPDTSIRDTGCWSLTRQ